MGLHLLGILVSFVLYKSLLIVISSYSYVSWEYIRSVYEPHEMTIQPKEIPADDLESLYKYLCRASRLLGPIHTYGPGGETATFCGTNPDPPR